MSNTLTVLYGKENELADLKRTTYTCLEKDYETIRRLFPEVGLISFLPGLIMHIIANECKRLELTNPYDRYQYPHLAGVPGLVASIGFIRNSDDRDVGRGTSGDLSDPESFARIVAKLQDFAHAQNQASQSEEGSKS